MHAPTIHGRAEELSSLNAMLTATDTRRHRLAVVRGVEGIGKTALLSVVDQRWRSRGVRVLRVDFRNVPEWDEFGAGPMLSAARKRFEDFGDGPTATAVAALRQLCQPDSYRSRRSRSGLLIAMARIVTQLAKRHPVVLLADDVDALPDPSLALAPVMRPGCAVVAAYTDHGEHPPTAKNLDAAADHVIDLGPLPDQCLPDLVADLTGTAPDDHLMSALRASLRSWSRHPSTLVSTVDHLRLDRRLVTVRGRTCLADAGPVALSPEHTLIDQLGPAGRDLVALAATRGRFGIDDLPALAAATGRAVDDHEETVDRLVAHGMLERVGRRLTCSCPALAERVLADGVPSVSRLHSAMARQLLDGRPGPGDGTCDGTDLTDQIALAGAGLPATPEHAHRLVVHADGIADTDPERALTWYRAALHHAAPDERQTILVELAQLSLRTGDYTGLLDLTDTAPWDAELAAAVTVAALHLGRPLPDAARACLPAAAEFHERRHCDAPVDVDALRSWSEVLADPGLPARTDDIAEAAETGDLAEVFRLLLGCAVTDTPLGLYHRVTHGYRTGDWSGALSSARRIELTGCPDQEMLSVIRLLAAEICAERGDLGEAVDWLADAGTGQRHLALHGWVACGLRWRAGEHGDAFVVGWRAYQGAAALGQVSGRERLLARLALIVAEGGRPEQARRVLAEAEGVGGREHPWASRQLPLFVRAAIARDGDAARQSVELARLRGDQPDLLAACLLASELAEAPRPWLHEAHAIAERLGTTKSQPRLRTMMRANGVAAPRSGLQSASISEIEWRVIDLVCDGRSNRQIATVMEVSVKTVEAYLTRLFAKTGVRSRRDLAKVTGKAYEHGVYGSPL